MGNSHQNSVTSKNFNPQDWQVTDRSGTEQSSTGTFKILKNIHTGQCIDQYQLMWPSQEDFRFYLDSYEWRKHQPHIVNSVFLVQNHHSQMCSKSYMAKIYIQHIYTRLSDIKDIPHPDNLYVILSMLQGYQKLYENLHYFKIQQDQVCIDMQGTVKVWVNSDLSKNYPQGSEYPGQFRNKDQSQMVDEIIQIVEQNTDHQFQPQSFQEFYFNRKGKKKLGFQQAKIIVNEYAKVHQTKIPNKFESILQMMKGDDQSSQNQNGSSTRNEHEQQFNHENHQNQHFGNVNNYHPFPVGGAAQNMPFNNIQKNYGSIPQSGYNSPHSNVYSNVPNQSFQTFYKPQITTQLLPLNSAGMPINQFAPRVYQPLNRPIFTIPASRGVSFSPNSHIIPNQIISNFPSKTLISSPNYMKNNLNKNENQQRSKHSNNQNIYQDQSHQQQEQFQIQGLSNDRQYRQIVSKLNNPNLDDEDQNNHEYMNDGNEQYDQFPSNHKTNQYGTQKSQHNNVSRSLQINNENTYNWSGAQNLNSRSHITNEKNNNNLLVGSNQKAGSLKQINSSSKLRSQKRSSTLTNDLKFYYTLDEQIQLDDQIAADLQKYIHAM